MKGQTPILYLLLLTSLLVQSKCGDGGSGTIDGIELGKGIWLDLEDLRKHSDYKPNVGEGIARYFSTLPPELDSLRIYNAKTEIADVSQPVRVAVIPLRKGVFQGAYLAINVLENGTVERVRIWGNDYTNADADSYLENFYRQFDGSRRLMPKAELLIKAEADSLVAGFNDKERYLFEHPLLMRSNSLIIRRTMALTGQDIVPPVEWYKAQEDHFSRMASNAHLLADFMDNNAISEYQQAAKASSDGLKKIVQGIDEGAKAGKVRDLIMDYRQVSCGSCHGIQANAGSDQEIFQVGKKYLRENFRDGIYRVGFDVWAIPDHNEASLYLTEIVKAGVYYLSYLDDRK